MSFQRHQLFLFIFLFNLPVMHGQGGTGIRAMVDKNKILIGEPIRLTIEADFTTGTVLSFVHIDTMNHFEFLGNPDFDTINASKGITIKGIYSITSFDSGHWVIPSFHLSPSVKTDTIPVDVVFSDFDPERDYHDLKNIIQVAPPKRKKWWWIIAGAVVIVVAVAVYLLSKKKPLPFPEPGIQDDPYKEAMKQLEQLQREKPAAKKYHSTLIDIFRLYVFRKKGILSLQKTTADLVLQLKDLPFSKEQSDQLFQALRLSDFVKFAKYVPTEDDDKKVFEDIRNSIMTIEKSESGPPAFGGS